MKTVVFQREIQNVFLEEAENFARKKRSNAEVIDDRLTLAIIDSEGYQEFDFFVNDLVLSQKLVSTMDVVKSKIEECKGALLHVSGKPPIVFIQPDSITEDDRQNYLKGMSEISLQEFRKIFTSDELRLKTLLLSLVKH